MDALAFVWRRKQRRQQEHTALLRWTIVSCFAKSAPKLEDFMPPDPDSDEQREASLDLQVDTVMRQVGGKAALDPTATPVVRSEADEEYVQRVNRLLNTEQ